MEVEVAEELGEGDSSLVGDNNIHPLSPNGVNVDSTSMPPPILFNDTDKAKMQHVQSR